MNLITDRTESDAIMGTAKGRYGAADLNRVEAAVAYLSLVAKSFVPVEKLNTKTDWGLPGPFSSASWNTQSQMNRYLSNVKTLCRNVGVSAKLPDSMENLTWEGANQIEKALLAVQDYVLKNFGGFRYSGEFYAGEEYGL